jgi:acetolactate synthase-1/2/3 large subunit
MPDSNTRNMSDLIVAYLEQLGVEYVFGVPGAHISALYEALERSAARGGPRAILTRHETGAANMADGYARETGKLGVCCATTGPGATNLVTGIASSYADHTPLLVLTGQTPLAKFGMAAFQESSPDMMDTAAMLAHCTYYSSVVSHAQQLENKLAKALMTALRTPRGPVHLSIPIDLTRIAAPENLSFPRLPDLVRQPPALLDTDAVATLSDLLATTLQRGQRAVILAGHECAGATAAIMALAEYTDAEVITTQRGKTRIDPFHPRVKGVFGYAGHESARQALTDESVGLILAAGTGLGQWSTSAWDKALLNDKLVHIHPLSDYFSRSPMARMHVNGAVQTVFAALLATLQQKGCEPAPATNSLSVSTAPTASTVPTDAPTPPQITTRQPEAYLTDRSPIHPQRLVYELMQGHFPADTRFIVDTTNWMPWTIHYFFTRQHQNYRLSSELAAMGWGLGAAVGTALGNPGTPVVCLAGDGGVLMNGQEITVAVEEKLPVIYLILNDGIYGMVQHRHNQVSEVDIKFGFRQADFKQMAEAVGAQGFRINTIDELLQLDFAALCHHPGPTVLDIMIDPEVTPPMGMF